jgi:repressor LexA
MPLIIYKKQRQILDFIKQFIQSNGSAPTLKQIADAIGVTSLATVHEHLEALEDKGLLKRKHGKNRSIELTQSDINFSAEAFEAPILGFIAAGQPIEPYTDPNATMNIPSGLTSGKKRTYVLQVRGQSMIEDHINDGDYVVIEQTDTAQDGEIVVALLDNGMATLKRFFKEATRIRLQPANSTMQPIFVKNVRIQGKVGGLVRKYKN